MTGHEKKCQKLQKKILQDTLQGQNVNYWNLEELAKSGYCTLNNVWLFYYFKCSFLLWIVILTFRWFLCVIGSILYRFEPNFKLELKFPNLQIYSHQLQMLLHQNTFSFVKSNLKNIFIISLYCPEKETISHLNYQ